MAARLREDKHLLTEGWSDWKRAMVPPETGGSNLERRRGNQVGLYCSSINNAFPNQAQYCGIYEWQARKSRRRNRVVYVGSTCRSKEGSLRDRTLNTAQTDPIKKIS